MAVLAAVRRVAGLVVLVLVAWAVMWAVMCATGAAATVRAEVAESIRTWLGLGLGLVLVSVLVLGLVRIRGRVRVDPHRAPCGPAAVIAVLLGRSSGTARAEGLVVARSGRWHHGGAWS